MMRLGAPLGILSGMSITLTARHFILIQFGHIPLVPVPEK